MKFDFEQRQRINEILPAVVDDPEYAASEIVKLESRIDAALALHVEIEGQFRAKVCRECSGMYSIAYPCPTVKALTGGKP